MEIDTPRFRLHQFACQEADGCNAHSARTPLAYQLGQAALTTIEQGWVVAVPDDMCVRLRLTPLGAGLLDRSLIQEALDFHHGNRTGFHQHDITDAQEVLDFYVGRVGDDGVRGDGCERGGSDDRLAAEGAAVSDPGIDWVARRVPPGRVLMGYAAGRLPDADPDSVAAVATAAAEVVQGHPAAEDLTMGQLALLFITVPLEEVPGELFDDGGDRSGLLLVAVGHIPEGLARTGVVG